MEPDQTQEFKKCLHQIVNLDELIDLVKVRPVIWDKTADGYRNKEQCAIAWDEICRVLFENYGYINWNEEFKAFAGKQVKQRWTTAKDVWQRSHKRRKEALQNGENISDMKDSVRYEKLKFLSKIYDRKDNFQSGNEDKYFMDKNGEIMDSPLSPQDDYNDDNDHVDQPHQVDIQSLMSQMIQKHNINLTSQKNNHETNARSVSQMKSDQTSSSHKTVVVNLDDKFKVGNLLSASKQRSSSVDFRDGKTSFNPKQSPKHETSLNPKQSPKHETSLNPKQSPKYVTSFNLKQSPKHETSFNPKQSPKYVTSFDLKQSPKHEQTTIPLEEAPSCSYSHSARNNPDQGAPKMNLKSYRDKDKDIPISSVDPIPAKHTLNKLKRKSSAPTTDETPQKRAAHREKSSNTQLEHFIEAIKPRIEDFNKMETMEFFFDILKPLIKDFDKHQLLDFQIEALQLIKKIEGNQVP